MNENKIVQQELNKFNNIILPVVTHWGRIMHICISKIIIIDSENGFLPVWPKPLSEAMLEYC